MKYMMFHMIGRRRKEISGRKKYGGRAFALLLGLALCVESVPLTVLAEDAGQEAAVAFEEGETPRIPENDTVSENDVPQSPDEGGEVQNPGENGESGEGEGQEPGGSVASGEGQESGENEEIQPPEEEESGGDAKEEEEPEQVSGNDTDTVSENDLYSVSDNALSSVSGNSLDAEREEMIKQAQEAFDELLSEKPLMALLYHADSYDARRDADEGSRTAATL